MTHRPAIKQAQITNNTIVLVASTWVKDASTSQNECLETEPKLQKLLLNPLNASVALIYRTQSTDLRFLHEDNTDM